MSKQGRLGDFMASIAVLFGVIIVMLIFATLSTGILGVDTIKGKLASSSTSNIKAANAALLFDNVAIGEETMTVLEALKGSAEDDIETEIFESAMEDMTPSGGCLILAWKWAGPGAADNVFGYAFNKKGEFKSESVSGDYRFNPVLDNYRNENMLSETTLSYLDKKQDEYALRDFDDSITYYTYRGGCMHE